MIEGIAHTPTPHQKKLKKKPTSSQMKKILKMENFDEFSSPPPSPLKYKKKFWIRTYLDLVMHLSPVFEAP